MATGYWRIKTNGNNFELYDHLPSAGARSLLVVKITVPGIAEEELYPDVPTFTADQSGLDAANIGAYSLVNPWSYPLIVEPADVAAETGSTFRDGVYRIRVDYTVGAVVYNFDEHFLHLPVADACISKKLDAYLASSCDKCKNKIQLNTLQELVAIRQGAQLDVNAGRITEAGLKTTLLCNICAGASCTCICGC